MRLEQLNAALPTPGRILRGEESGEITAIAFDSEAVEWGSLFVCVSGANADGHDFAQAALLAGAEALVVERELDLEVGQLLVPDSRRAMGPLAALIFGDPSRELE